MRTKLETLDLLKHELHQHVRGQSEALNRLWEEVDMRESGTIPQHGPRACYFFAGPTGVGKTKSAEILAKTLVGPECFLRIDCSEYKTLESLTLLLGDQAGNRGRLGRFYDAAPEAVWLWDEIEKGHPELVQLFLQMADKGRLTLACGETLDLSGTYLILTSNLGSAEIIGREHLPFTSLERHVVGAIQKFLRPELLARFGKPFVFRPLGLEIQAEIAEHRLAALLAWHKTEGRTVEEGPEVLAFMIYRGFSKLLGARPLVDFIEKSVGAAVRDHQRAGGTGNGRLTVVENRLTLV